MNLIRQQIAYASVVHPQGDIAPAWQAFLQSVVDAEAFVAWARGSDSGLTLSVETEARRPWSLAKWLAGLLP